MAGVLGRLLDRFHLTPVQQIALLRVRMLLSVRQFSKEPGKILGLIISAVVFIPLSIGAGIGTGIGYLNLPDLWPAHLLGIVFVVVWLIWAVMPILLFGSNEAMDMTRLLLYPLGKRDLVVTTFTGAFFDFTTYLLIPLFIAPFMRWSVWPVLPIFLLGLLICYANLIIINQLTLIAAGGILRSRRFRDVMIVFLSFFGFSCYFLQQGVYYFIEKLDLQNASALSPLSVLQWHPTGAVARAIQLAEAEMWWASLLWLLYSCAWIVLFLWIWQTLFRRIVTGQGFLHTGLGVQREERKERQKAEAKSVSGGGQSSGMRSAFSRIWSWLPYSSQQIFVKEMKSIWRVPQRRIGLIQGLLLPMFFAAPAIFSGDSPQEMLGDRIWVILPVYALFTTWVFGMNMLGWEGRSLATLLATPIGRWPLLVSKCLALLLLVMIPITLLSLVITIYLGNFFGLVGWSIAIGLSAAILGLMVVASVLFPYPVNLDSYRQQMSLSGGSCVAALVNMLAIPILLGVVASPIVGLIGLAIWRGQDSLIAMATIVAPIYGALLFTVGTYIAARLLSTREPEVLVATRVADGS